MRSRAALRLAGLLLKQGVQEYTRPGAFPAGRLGNPTSFLPFRSGLHSSSCSLFTSAQWLSPALRSAVRAKARQASENVHSAVQSQQDKAQRAANKVEAAIITVLNSISLSNAGEKLLASSLPLAIAAAIFPGRCRAYEMPSPLMAARQQQQRQQQQQQQTGIQYQLQWLVTSMVEELFTTLRGIYLMCLFMPAMISAPLAFYFNVGRMAWMQLIHWTLERAGPAFIKWGQWASTRPDLFPQDLCAALEKLQTKAPSHSPLQSVAAVEAAFQCRIDQLFDEFELEPVASGSIAQIHRAKLTPAVAAACRVKPGTEVAVKVRHPGVTDMMYRDFVLMTRAAAASRLLPATRELRLDESIRQFGGPLKEQLDLQVEAQHLQRFQRNFRLWRNVSFPTPIPGLVSSDVLVETFEEGVLISKFVKGVSTKYNDKIAETGMLLYLQMLLKDNFIHADLHPGNILVREVGNSSGSSSSVATGRYAALAPLQQAWRRLASYVDFQPKLILLDTGMIAELTGPDQRSLVQFFTSLTKQDGEGIAHSILSMSESHACPDREAFIADMKTMFDELDPETIRKYTSDVLRDMIEMVRQHQVTLKSTVSTVVVTTLVLEGWSSKLNPDMKILDSMRDMLATDWRDRVGRAVDKIMASGSLAVM